MRQGNRAVEKIIKREALIAWRNRLRLVSRSIAFTNGVFDILHQGHIKVLTEAASFADVLIVGVNSDASVKRLKGPERPINDEQSRACLLSSLVMVDAVVIFEEDTPLNIINIIKPDILIKGGDYSVDQIAGSREVQAYGGTVEIIQMAQGFSTTGIIDKLKSLQ
ncbi:MAG: D-glycero-beta-D-manno-heptose 1-phosphate adenylyltransferase [Ginsengibacter sp.]